MSSAPGIVKQLIRSNPAFRKAMPENEAFLDVAEFFCDSIQGENFVGWPASFLRLQHCTLYCDWCDTRSVWRDGNPYTFQELFDLMEDPQFDLIRKFSEGQHLILTGGSPLRQQKRLIAFFEQFQNRYGFLPFLEIENECTLMPEEKMVSLIRLWNNSPKLSHSKNPQQQRYKPPILKYLSGLDHAWFKFVIGSPDDWDEIRRDFLEPGLIRKSQIVLMPLAGSREELHAHRHMVFEMAVTHNVRYCTREHVELWDVLTGA